MTVDFALRLASAAARVLAPQGGTVLIGKDTRVSGYMFESALEAGFVAAGVDVLLTGPMPTPAIAVLTKKLGADFGIVISASHNPITTTASSSSTRKARSSPTRSRKRSRPAGRAARDTRLARLGQAKNARTARGDYMGFCKATIPAGMGFEDFKIVVDASHGAGYKVAPRVMSDLGADVVPVGCSPNGRNINDGCGSTRPDLLQAHRHRGRRARRLGARRRWRPRRHGRRARQSRRWRPARVHLGSRSLRVAQPARSRGRHRDEQSGARARAAGARRRVPARQGRRPQRARDAEGARAASSAAKRRATSFASIARRPAMGSSRRCRCSPSCSARAAR